MSWGDGDTTDWQPPVAAGDTLALDRRYGPGSHNVRCQALDSRSALSRWSDPATVTVAGGPPFPDSIIEVLDVNSEQAALTSDGAIAYVSGNHEILTVDLRDGTVLARHQFPGSWAVALSPDDSRLYATSADSLFTLRTSDFAILDTITMPGAWLSDITVSPDGNHLYVAGTESGLIYKCSSSPLAVLDDVGFYWPWTLALSHDGGTLYGGGCEDAILEIDARSFSVRDEFGEFEGIYNLALDPTDSFLYAWEDGDWAFTTWAIPTSNPAAMERLSLAGTASCVTPDGRYLYIGGEEAIYVLRRQDSHLVASLPLPPRCDVGRMIPTRDGTRVLVLGGPQSTLLGLRQSR